VLWQRAPNAATWVTQSAGFTVTIALMSMVGYVIGLGDRHPSNAMAQRETGKVIHVDFGDSFETGMTKNKFPERPPFRLMRMIVNALDCGTVEGVSQQTCEDVACVLGDSQAPLIALLDIFVHEPLDGLAGRGQRCSQTEIIDRGSQKLFRRDAMLTVYQDTAKGMDIETHVGALVQAVSDPNNYVMHYTKWCAFW